MSHRTFFVWLSFLIAVAAIGMCFDQSAAAQTGTEVLYVQQRSNNVLQSSTILTYNIDRQTLQATLSRQPLILQGSPQYIQLSGGFLYILSGTQQSYPNQTLAVYATDASGAPQMPPVQILGPAPISNFTIDPNGGFAYTFTKGHTTGKGETTYKLHLYTVNSATGKLETPQVEATYAVSYYCAPAFNSFSPNGDQLVDVVYCNYPDSSSATYYSRTVNAQSGQLGPDAEFFSVNDALGSDADEVTITPKTIIDFQQQLSPYAVSLLVYSRKVNPKTPIIDCSAATLPVCGEATGYVSDISGQFLALSLSSNIWDIVKVDLSDKQIVDTGNTFPYPQFPTFSPDDLILYGQNQVYEGISTIQIYGFNPSTGGLTPGGQISVSPTLWNIFPAIRN